MKDKIFIHWNLPREIHREAAKSKDFTLTVFKKSTHLQALKDGFLKNNIELRTLGNYNYLLEQASNTGFINEIQLKTLSNWNKNPSEWDVN